MAVGVAASSGEAEDRVAKPELAVADAAVAEESSNVSLDKGVPRMTPEVLQEICVKNQGWSKPELNDALVLSYKGFRKIENLQPYVNVKTIWLEANGISRIEGLSALPGLLSLYLQSNCIESIHNLDALTSLKYLNLSHNSLQQVTGLENLHELETLKLAANKFTDVSAFEGLRDRPTLRDVDVSQNYIEDGEAYLSFWEMALPDVQCLYLHRNPCSRTLRDYRRRLVSGLKKLRWIDDRKVDELERVGAEAWAVGGKDAEFEAKKNHVLKEREDKARSFESYQRMSKAAAQRRSAMLEAQAERDSARKDAAEELTSTGNLADGWVTTDATPKPFPAASGESQCAEHSREAAAREKVQAFLANRTQSTDAETLVDPAVTDDAAAEVADETAEVGQEMAETLRDEEVQDTDEALDDSTADLEEPAAEFVWTPFKERRLGSLAAEHRYDMRKVAPLLSEEFSCVVDAEACRAQLRKVMKPRENQETKLSYTGRARDAPDTDPSELQEVSKWWMRQLKQGGRQPSRQKAQPVAEAPTASTCHGLDALDDTSEGQFGYAASADGLHPPSASSALPPPSTASSVASMLAGMDRHSAFAPPPRVAAQEEIVELAPPLRGDPAAGSSSPAVTRGATSLGSELFELD